VVTNIEDVESLLDYDRVIDYADSDWDGDGIFEVREYTPLNKEPN
jgi:hypothetical protein